MLPPPPKLLDSRPFINVLEWLDEISKFFGCQPSNNDQSVPSFWRLPITHTVMKTYSEMSHLQKFDFKEVEWLLIEVLWIEPGGWHEALFTLQKLKEIRRLSFFKDFNPLCNTARKTFLIPSIKISTAAATSDSSILPSPKKKDLESNFFQKVLRRFCFDGPFKKMNETFFRPSTKDFLCWTLLSRKKRQLPNLKCNFPIVASYVLHFSKVEKASISCRFFRLFSCLWKSCE